MAKARAGESMRKSMRFSRGKSVAIIVLAAFTAIFSLCAVTTPWIVRESIYVRASDCTIDVWQWWYTSHRDCNRYSCVVVGYDNSLGRCESYTENWRDRCNVDRADWGDLSNPDRPETQPRCPREEQVNDVAMAFAIITCVLAWAAAVCMCLIYPGDMYSGQPLWYVWLGLCIGSALMLISNLVAVAVYAALLPSSIRDDRFEIASDSSDPRVPTCEDGLCTSFAGSTDYPAAVRRWGPGPGWIMACLNFLFILPQLLLTIFNMPPYIASSRNSDDDAALVHVVVHLLLCVNAADADAGVHRAHRRRAVRHRQGRRLVLDA